MASTGLLFLASVNGATKRLRSLLSAASKHVSRTLYVQLYPNNHHPGSISNKFLNILTAVYSNSAIVCDHLDVRVLLTPFKNNKVPRTKSILDVVLTDSKAQVLTDALAPYKSLPIHHLGEDLDDDQNPPTAESDHIKVYNKVVLGGTFDRLHNGHKILLSEALARCTQQLTVGITDGPMLNNKTLWELIQPVDLRSRMLREFLEDVDGSVEYDIQPIVDPYGPSVQDPTLECIVVSEETRGGGNKVNEVRQSKGMSVLDMHIVDLALDLHRTEREEAKISSSSTRMRLLGTRLRDPTPRPHLPQKPYVIGLTGGIASGKSSIAGHLGKLGAAVVNCDKLGHSVYTQGAPVLKEIVDKFGNDVLDPSGNVDRKLLGLKAFSSPDQLQELNRIVWPHVKRLALSEVQRLADAGAGVVVLEAALLIEAGWDDMVHEVWVAVIPQNEAVKRIQARDSLGEDQALRRVQSQSSNAEKISRGNIVFCTAWEKEFTFAQVSKAWREVQRRLTE